MALVTAAQARLLLPSLTGTGADTDLDTMIARADALIAQWCLYPATDAGTYTLEDSTYTAYVSAPDPWDPIALPLPVRPVVSITSAYSDPTRTYAADSLLAAGEYVLDGQAGRLILTPTASHGWSTGTRANKITMVAGLTGASLDLAQIVCAQVRHLWDLRRTQGLQSAQVAGRSETRMGLQDSLIAPVVREALGPWRMLERACTVGLT